MLQRVTHAKRVFQVEAGFAELGDADANAMQRPRNAYTTGVTLPGTGVVANWNTGSYAFDGVGNIKTEGSDTFVYDKVSRLVSARINSVTEAYAFDAFGNMTSYAGRALALDPATNRLTTGASYDAAGNLTDWTVAPNTYSATWDKLNQQISHTGLGINRLLAYTAAGERILVRDQLANQATITLRDLAGHVVREVSVTTTVNNGPLQWEKDYIYRGGLLLASQTRGQGIRHYALDHLGSPRLLTNRTGEKLKLFSTNAWGQDTTGTPQQTERMRFTGHERDLGMLDLTGDDLDYMHARYYPPYLARFMSVDPGRDVDPKVPQSWNLYAYVRNNPINGTDLDGRAVTVVITRDTYTSDTVTGTILVTSDVQDAGEFSGFTLETTAAGDNGDKDPISPGKFDAFVRTDHDPNRIELESVPSFTNIQIHVGNTRDDVKGCFAAGEQRAKDKVIDSTKAMKAILSVIEKDKSGVITVEVKGESKKKEKVTDDSDKFQPTRVGGLG